MKSINFTGGQANSVTISTKKQKISSKKQLIMQHTLNTAKKSGQTNTNKQICLQISLSTNTFGDTNRAIF